MIEDLKRRWVGVQERIQKACEASHRDPSSIRLVAVSKRHPSKMIEALYENFGHKDFGENYIQELAQKNLDLPYKDIHWHFLGRLQGNKIAKLTQKHLSIHCLESEKHAEKLFNTRSEVGNGCQVFLPISFVGEAQKSGLTDLEFKELVKVVMSRFGSLLQVDGAMGLPPVALQSCDGNEVVSLYSKWMNPAKELELPFISLGMSHDLEAAITAGATHLRVGTAIFGPRES